MRLSEFCNCGQPHNHAAHCHTVRAAYLLAERYRDLATQIRAYGQEQHAAIQTNERLAERAAGKRDGAYEIADWLRNHADQVERHAR